MYVYNMRGRPAKIQISHRDTRDFKHNLRETTAATKARPPRIDNRTLRRPHQYDEKKEMKKNYTVRLRYMKLRREVDRY